MLVLLVVINPYAQEVGGATNLCPGSVDQAVELISSSLQSKRWVHIDINNCPDLQSKLLENVDSLIRKSNFETYIPLMSKSTLRIVRNAFFAVKGYIFKDPDLKTHFSKYPWYVPSVNKPIKLRGLDKARVELLKEIEDTWFNHCNMNGYCGPAQPLPEGCKISENNGKQFLQLNKSVIDITKNRPGWSGYEYLVNGVSERNAVLVCKSGLSGDFANIEKISYFTKDGRELYTNDKLRHLKGFQCPFWIRQRPNLLFHLVWNSLTILDQKLQPAGSLGVTCFPEEMNCYAVEIVYVKNSNDIYVYVNTGFSEMKSQGSNAYFYDESSGAQILKEALWFVNDTGKLSLITEAAEKASKENENSKIDKWYIKSTESRSPVVLFPNRDGYSRNNRIGTAVRSPLGLILFGVDRDNNMPSGTTIIPLPK